MDKSDRRRRDILNRLAGHMLAEGLSGSSLRALADAARTSDRMLLYYFSDKSEIITETLGVIGARLTDLLEARTASTPQPLEKLQPVLVATVLEKELWPYMRLWLEISALASRDDPFYRAVGGQMGRSFLDWGKSQLKSTSPRARDAEAARLLLTIEGVLLLKSIGMEDVFQAAL